MHMVRNGSFEMERDGLVAEMGVPLGTAVQRVRRALDALGIIVMSEEEGPSRVRLRGESPADCDVVVEDVGDAVRVEFPAALDEPAQVRDRIRVALTVLAAEDFDPETAAPAPVVKELGVHECLRLIHGEGIGRVAFCDIEGPAVAPVNYLMDGESIVFRTAKGGWLDRALTTDIAGAAVHAAFQVDQTDPEAQEGWTVLARGPVVRLEAPPRKTARPWVGGHREACYRFIPTSLTGRRLTAA